MTSQHPFYVLLGRMICFKTILLAAIQSSTDVRNSNLPICRDCDPEREMKHGNTRRGFQKETHSQVGGVGQKPDIEDIVGMACTND